MNDFEKTNLIAKEREGLRKEIIEIKNMERKPGFISILLFIALLLLLPDLSGEGKVSIKLTGGLNYSLFGDVNAGAKGGLDFWRDQVVSVGGSYISDIKPLHVGQIFSLDFVYKINAQYSVALGVGYVRAHNRSNITLLWPLEPESTASAFPDARAIPVRLSVLNFIPINQRMSLFFAAGLDTYFAQYRSDDWPGGAGNSNHQKAHAIGVGVRYGVGLDIKLTRSLAFVIEGQGCYAKISGFRGTLKSGGSTLPYEEKGTLYYWESMAGPGQLTPYPIVLIQATRPSSEIDINVRKARVDFSGFSLLAGIKISL